MLASADGTDGPLKMVTVGERNKNCVNVWIVKNLCTSSGERAISVLIPGKSACRI